jgi:hypothetical protein
MQAIESLLKMTLSLIPSTWNIVISSIVFVLAILFLQKWMNKSDQTKSAGRGFAVFALAFALSWGSGWLVDYALLTFDGPQPKSFLQQLLEKQIADAGIVLPD